MNIRCLILVLIFNSCSAQNHDQKKSFIFFESESNDHYYKKNDSETIDEKVYRMVKNKDNTISFYIKSELFLFDSKTNKKELIDHEQFNKINFLTIEQLNKAWKNSDLFSKRGVFKDLYLVKKGERKDTFELLKVEWIDYSS